jgi:hypothetical protein
MAVTVIKNYSRKVAAPKKSKTGLIIGISLLIIGSGLGIYFWYKSKNPKTPTSETDTNPDKDKNTTPDSDKGTSPTIETTIKTDTNPVIITGGEPKDVLAFQKWANKYKGTTLKEDGKFGDLSKAAWNSFGVEYNKALNASNVLKPTGYVLNDKLEAIFTMLNPNGAKAYLIPSGKQLVGDFKLAYFVKDWNNVLFVGKIYVKLLSGQFSWKEVYLKRSDWKKVTSASIKY